MQELLFLLLPVAAGYGYIMGRNSLRQAQHKQSKILSKHYFKGLNFLFSDEPDKAVDTLMKMINVNTDTAETHIAMGNFFRHRGELDRAIRIHQNLIDKTDIETAQRELALKELGRDYLLAGFLERAESAFIQLLNSKKHFLDAQQQLFSVYQTTKDWDKAIELAERLEAGDSESEELNDRLSHYYCEQAQLEIKTEDYPAAIALLKKAIEINRQAIRPWLMWGQIALEQKAYNQAVDCLVEIPARDIEWLPEAIPLFKSICEQTGDWQPLTELLAQYGNECASAYLTQVELDIQQGHYTEAGDRLLDHLHKRPTVKGYDALLQLYITESQEGSRHRQSLEELQTLIHNQITQRPKYRCSNCGFSGKQIHWLCPSCKSWGTGKPIKGLDGE